LAKGSSGRSGPTSKRCPRESAPSSAGPQASLPMGASSNFATLTVTGCGSVRRPPEPARRHRPGEPGTWEGAQRPARRAAAAAPTMTLPARAPSARGGGRQRRLVNPAITPMSLIDRPDQDVPVPAAACRMAFTAYPGGSRSGGRRGTTVIWLGAAVIAPSSTCGGAGMSWTAGAGCV